MKKKLIYSIVSCFLVLSSCNELSNNLQNPSVPLPNQGNLDLVLNAVQMSAQGFYWDLSDIGAQLTRQEVMFGPLYKNALPANSFDQAWADAYQGVLVNAKTIIDQGSAQKQYVHVAIARTLQAYTLMTLVDFFGDVPFSAAFGGASNTTPTLDNAKDVYTAALAALDSAALNIGKTPGSTFVTSLDLFYGTGTAASWLPVINSLKLKAYMNLAQDPSSQAAALTAIQSLVNGSLIDDATGAEDFQFDYGTSYTNPNSRHPKFNGNYTASGAGSFLGTFFMYVAVAEKTIINGSTVDDPRRRFYFYRPNGDAVANVAATALPCKTQNPPAWYSSYSYWYPTSFGMPFCQLGNTGTAIGTGYWGRDHGDNSGVPPDGQLRTTYGVYPAAGVYDNSAFTNVAGSSAYKLGGQGKGIAPIWLASYTEFLKAEAALTLGISLASAQSLGTSAAAAVNAGVKASVEKVVAFGNVAGVPIPASRVTTLNAAAGTVGAKATYYSYVANAFTNAAASGAGGKLDIASREFYIATYGNGIEAYNLYRRTGYPSGMQLLLAHDANSDASDPVFRSCLYPAAAVNRNSAIAQKTGVGTGVFWDQNLPIQ